jgi:hypothetical protein
MHVFVGRNLSVLKFASRQERYARNNSRIWKNLCEPISVCHSAAPRRTMGHAATRCASRLSARRPIRVIYQYTYCLRLFSKVVLSFSPPIRRWILNGQPNNDWGGRISAFGGALAAFKKMLELDGRRRCKPIDWKGEYRKHDECSACEQWWEQHCILHKALHCKLWQWPCVENPDAENSYPKGSEAARIWQPDLKARARFRALEAACREPVPPAAA